ncbi:MAG TPA: TonB-dependent receptor [Cellvibrio sp.]|nr:TonB-dependent receptor [Cellvibrio sp.]
MLKQKKYSHFSSSLSFFGFCLSLSAQSVLADTEASDVREEVVVTAAKREQSLKDFPGSISVVKTDSLNPGASLADVANQVPGLSIIDNGPRNSTAIVIRGLRTDTIDSDDFSGDGSLVASYVDNIPLQGFFVPPAFSLKDLQQIEVLRGPQGTLYGNASIGGLIRYITNKPDIEKAAAKVTASLSQTDESHGLNYDTDVVVNTPLIADELAVRVLLGKKENQGFIDNQYLLSGGKKDINSDEADQLRTSILWQPTDEFSLSSSYDYQKVRVDDRQASNKTITGDDYGSSSRYRQPMDGQLRLASVDANYQFDWASLTASLNRYDYLASTRSDQTDYLLTNYGEDYFDLYPQFSGYTKSRADVVKDSAEVRLVSPGDQSLRWLVGLFASNDDLDFVVADRVPGAAAFFSEERRDDLDYLATQAETLREQSLYGELAYDILPKLELAIGARYFRYEDNLDSCSEYFSGQDNQYYQGCVVGDDVQKDTQGKFSSKYKFNDKQSVYFAVAQGFRRGGANLLPVGAESDLRYEPDTNINYEVGTHSEFLNGKIQLSSAIFYMYWKHIQFKTYGELGYEIVANAGDARAKGFELESRLELTAALSAIVGYSYAHAEISENVVNINGEGGNVYIGDRLPGSPQDQVNLGLDYKHKFGGASWDTSLSYAYSGDSTTAANKDFPDYLTLDGYGLIHIRSTVVFSNWSIGAYINNLNNTRAVTNTRTSRWYGERGRFEYITRPRTIGLAFQYKF